MAIRTNPLLRLQSDEKRGNHTAKGQSINSEGVEGKAMWGKRAKWVDYWAPDGRSHRRHRDHGSSVQSAASDLVARQAVRSGRGQSVWDS